MGQNIATIVIERRSLVRGALVSLMASHSFQIVGEIASPADINKSLVFADPPGLVILSALPVDEAANASARIRKVWPEAKIILLIDRVSPGDFQKVLTSEIDGCIPLFASPDTLLDTLRRIISSDLRILVLKSETGSSLPCQEAREETDQLHLAPNRPAQSNELESGVIDCSASLRLACSLSRREEEILKGVVKGHSNKMIARACGVTDATIKVHMKSILRKIRVANRTQAAIWALERGYGAEVLRRPPTLGPVAYGAAAP